MRSKELPAELRDRIVSRHGSGEGYKKMSAALKVPKSSVFHNSQMEENQDSSKSWPPSQIDWEGPCLDWWPRSHDHICRWEKPTEGQTSLQYSTDLGFMAVWPNSILSSVKTHENTLGICKTAPKGSLDSDKQDSLIWSTSIPSIMFEGNQLCSSPVEYHPKIKVCW